MNANDLFLLDQRREARRKAQAPKVDGDDFFNVFVAELVTQDYQLPGPEHLQYGVVDGPQDCGIDAVYTFVNGSLVTDEFTGAMIPKRPDLDLFILQAKTSQSFVETALEKWAMYLPKLLSIDRSETELEGICNPALMRETQRFLDTYLALSVKRPNLNITLVYATRGNEPSIGVVRKAQLTREALEPLYSEARISFKPLGCRELIDLSRRPAQVSRILRLAEVPISGETGDGYICLVRLRDYVELITDPHTGRLDAALFEANVREHEGETDVNSDIRLTLEAHEDSYDFWWLNNGVTVVADDIDQAGKRLTLSSPQIVNGLQTSTEIFKHHSRGGNSGERHLLVRVIKASTARVRDMVVKATNSQNELPLSALRATETLQRDIEEFLEHHGLYYDRRRNYARTRDYDEKRVVSMTFAGHAVASALLQRPHECRRLGPSMLNDDRWYERIFDEQLSLNVFLKSILLLRVVQAAVISDGRVRGTSVEDWQYHVAYVAAIMLTKSARPSPKDMGGLDISGLSEVAIKNLIEIVAVEYGSAIPASSRWMFSDLSTNAKVTEAIGRRAAGFLKSSRWHAWQHRAIDPQYAIRADEVFYGRVRGDQKER